MNPSLFEKMQQPDFYPHPVQSPIQVEQTHASYVFLTGEYAYKVKKAVDFGFFDYSELQKRKHFCQEEIRLNHPLAPEIYLEVLPIAQQQDTFKLAEEGEVIEYTLKMRQFPQEMLWSHLFEAGKLTSERLEELGRVVAQFHLNAETNDYIRSFGEIAKIREAFDENYRQSEKYIGRNQTQAKFDQTKHFTDTFFDTETKLFASRREQNWIRECHGDLHLKNICLWEDEVRLFDRIEFNEPFRFVDVMYDVAFAKMDLDARHRSDLGNAFLNTYIEQTGDWEGLQILPLYLTRQAYVRAKVTSFLIDDPDVPQIQKQKAATTAANYYDLAWQYTQTNRGKLLIMSGLSGSGKTTVARQLARQWDAIHIRSDAVRKHLAGISLADRGDDSIYTPEMSRKTYDRLLQLGQLLVNRGFTVILDAKYDRVALRQPVIEWVERQEIPFEILHCSAPMEVLRDRLAARSGDISDATPDLLNRQLANAEPFTTAEQGYVRKCESRLT
jgi:aminoglycoside phosphotransferase family enzyme/predicted kinase